jgi:hypothetical protein
MLYSRTFGSSWLRVAANNDASEQRASNDRHHNLFTNYEISVSQMVTNMFRFSKLQYRPPLLMHQLLLDSEQE